MGTRTSIGNEANSLKQEGKRVGRQATTSPVMETLMRLGYVARGLVYGMIGVLAFQVAMGVGGSLNDPQGAIVALGRTPLGGVVLYGILLGLIGYALWGFIRAVFNPLHKNIVERVGFAVSGISYTLLAFATYGLITGGASAAQNGAQGAQTQQTTASILSQPWGSFVVGIAGLIVIGVGIVQMYKGLQRNFQKQFQAFSLSSVQQTWIDRLGRFGTAARGVVFALIGMFLFLAAYNHNPSQAQGIDGVLKALLHQPYGPWLLGVVALGLVAFGIYSVMCGIWLRLKR
jgi:uncharacterized protein DUF1206